MVVLIGEIPQVMSDKNEELNEKQICYNSSQNNSNQTLKILRQNTSTCI